MPQDMIDSADPDAPKEEGLFAAFLSFDRAKYTFGHVPCQALAAFYHLSGLSFHVTNVDGSKWTVTKKQIRDFMEHGHYVWVRSTAAEHIDMAQGVSLELSCVKRISDYKPVHKRLVTEADVKALLGQQAKMFILKGRKRRYHPDGKVGVSVNLSTKSAYGDYFGGENAS